MAILLLLILILLALAAYLKGKRDLLSPWFLLCFACCGSFFIVVLNFENWDLKINGTFVIYLITAIISFGLGTFLINLFSKKKLQAKTMSIDIDSHISVKYPIKTLLIASFFTTTVYLLKLIIDAGGIAGSFFTMLRTIYTSVANGGYTPGFLFNQMREISTAIGYISMFRLIIKLYTPKDKIKASGLLIPIILFVLMSLISSDRNVFLRFAIFSICVSIVVYYTKCNDYKIKKLDRRAVNSKMIIRVSFIVVAVVLIFYLFGKMKLYTSNLERMLGIYGGSGLYNFNLWIENFNGPYTYGQTTFGKLFSTLGILLKLFGIDLNLLGVREDFIIFQTSNGYVYSSNIYSAMHFYVADFGYAGVILIPLALGILFQWLFNQAKKKEGFSALLYCLLIYAVIYFPILEQFFRRFHLGFVYEIGWLAIVYYSIYGRKKMRRIKMRKAGRGYEKTN